MIDSASGGDSAPGGEPAVGGARVSAFQDFALRLIACFAVLWTPFFFFSSFRGHPLPVSALALSALLFAAVAMAFALLMGRHAGLRRVALMTALIGLFLDVQVSQFDGVIAILGTIALAGLAWLVRENLTLITVAIFATVFVSGAITPTTTSYIDQTTQTPIEAAGNEVAAPSSADSHGLIVHLILDAFTGLAGIPAEFDDGRSLERELAAFFRSYEFSVAPHAISEYAASRNSISGILNFDASPTPDRHVHGKRPYILKNNAYFEGLRARGFEIAVYQSTYMDFCRETPVPLVSCLTYRYDGTDWLKTASMSDREKLSVMLGLYLSLPGAFESGWKAYVGLRRWASGIGLSLPPIMTWDGILAPIATRSVFGSVRHSIIESPPGTAHIAHLLMPHGPYVYDASCALREDPLGWLGSHPLYEKDNTPAGRAQRYPQYFAQVRCLLRDLAALFDDLKAAGRWDDTELILHGDHGARIFLTAPRTENRDRLTPQDLRDGFSTLFAVKRPGGPVAFEVKTTPVSQLLGNLVRSDRALDTTGDPAVVYLESRNDAPWTAIPYPAAPSNEAVRQATE